MNGETPPPGIPGSPSWPRDVADTRRLLAEGGYVADAALATSVHLALRMGRPLFLEGEPGTGKTEIAKVLAARLPRRLVRLQCYDGLDLNAAAYEWDHAKQLMAIRLAEASGSADDAAALERADEPFEAFLLDILADNQITVPEPGTIRAQVPPVVIITSNRTREVHDAIRRRCLYHWVDYPDAARERAILEARAPGLSERLSREVVGFVQALRRGPDWFKLPGVAETIDWARALAALGARELEPALVEETLGVLLKYQDDIARLRGEEAAQLLAEARQVAEA